MARTWLSIHVDLVEGGGHDSIWPRPGRIFAAARSHTFPQLATAIDDAFTRWGSLAPAQLRHSGDAAHRALPLGRAGEHGVT
jgi:hypothetical protein